MCYNIFLGEIMAHKDKADLYRYQVNRWREIKKKAVELMGGKCCKCGFDAHPSALQFHHLDAETKDVSWNKLRLRSWDKIVSELKKCIMLCANCHAIEHAISKYD
jgi:predicted HNH restriction endonuclease